jgi:hypothetical protein
VHDAIDSEIKIVDCGRSPSSSGTKRSRELPGGPHSRVLVVVHDSQKVVSMVESKQSYAFGPVCRGVGNWPVAAELVQAEQGQR